MLSTADRETSGNTESQSPEVNEFYRPRSSSLKSVNNSEVVYLFILHGAMDCGGKKKNPYASVTVPPAPVRQRPLVTSVTYLGYW